MWILRIALVALVLGRVNCLACHEPCETNHKSCVLQTNEKNGTCTLRCSEKENLNDECKSSAGISECFCKEDNCHKKPSIITKWKMSLPSLSYEIQKKVELCIDGTAELNCGAVCGETSHRSCAVQMNENGECNVMCSEKNGTGNVCSSIGSNGLECLCEGHDCHRSSDVVKIWLRQLEDKFVSNPSLVEQFERGLAENGWLKQSDWSICNGKQCYEGRERSCRFQIKKNEDCTATCSYKPPESYCEMQDDQILCTCFAPEKHCHKSKSWMRYWREDAENMNVTSYVDDCLYKTGALSKRKCGDVDCFIENDKSCKLVVADEAEKCTFECSNEDYVADKCTSSGCFCKDGNCYHQEGTVTKWRKDQKKPIGLDTCLVKQNALSNKTCGGNHCFKNKDKSCILAFKPDGDSCDVKCSAEAASNQCKLKNGTMECSSATDDFRMNKPLIRNLEEQRSKSKFNKAIEKCLQQKGMLKNETCGEETCFFGHDHCALLLNEKDSKIGCTAKKGSSCTEINSRGSYQYECLCEGQNCLKQEAMITELMKVQKKMKFSRTLEASLIRQDILTTESCGGNKCFVGFDGLCKVEAQLSGNCDLGCSKKTNAIDKCELINNETIIQCFCEEDNCHREKSRVNKWQKEVEAMHPTLTSEMEKCLHDKGDLKESFKCGHQQCYKGRDTCKLEARNGTCSMECSTEKNSNLKCKKSENDYQCFCETEGCLQSKDTMSKWKTTIVSNGTAGENILRCIDRTEARITTAAPPTTTTLVQRSTKTKKMESGKESSSSKNGHFFLVLVLVKVF